MKMLAMARLALRGIDSLLGRMRPIHVAPSSGNQAQHPAVSAVRARWAMLHRRHMAEASAKLRCSKVQGDASGKLDRRLQPSPSPNHIMISMGEHSAITQGMKNQQDAKELIPGNAIYSDGTSAAARATLEVVDAKHGTKEIVGVITHDYCSDDDCQEEAPTPLTNGVYPLKILENSSHHDGSIYKNMKGWKTWFCVSDRTETRFEAMMLSEGKDCAIDDDDGQCVYHTTEDMLQIFSLKLAKVHMDCDSIELYGYIAVRDDLDLSLNYVVNFSRDDPITLEQGCLLNMSGPKRGIKISEDVLIEYDMRIKTQGKDDLQLIDGASIINTMTVDTRNYTFTKRVQGAGGAIDMTASHLFDAVEATVEVVISQIQSSFNLCLRCFTSGILEEIILFDGAICEPGGLNRSVVAVLMDTELDLDLKVGTGSSIPDRHYCSFKADMHGYSTQEIKTNLALISVKVTWSTLPD